MVACASLIGQVTGVVSMWMHVRVIHVLMVESVLMTSTDSHVTAQILGQCAAINV